MCGEGRVEVDVEGVDLEELALEYDGLGVVWTTRGVEASAIGEMVERLLGIRLFESLFRADGSYSGIGSREKRSGFETAILCARRWDERLPGFLTDEYIPPAVLGRLACACLGINCGVIGCPINPFLVGNVGSELC